MTDPIELAFPGIQILHDIDGNMINKISHPGISKREYFAAMALSGLTVAAISGGHNADTTQANYDRARQAVNLADALIDVLNNK